MEAKEGLEGAIKQIVDCNLVEVSLFQGEQCWHKLGTPHELYTYWEPMIASKEGHL